MEVINLKKCNFDYLFNTPNIEDIETFINQLTNKYIFELKKIELLNSKILLSYDKDKYIELIKKHKNIVLSLIKEVINFFPQLSNVPHIVFIHGSFAKTLNRINSDIDLNILYPNNFKSEILPIEEIISIILQKVVGYSGRDKIHTMMLYTYNDLNYSLVESTEECTISFPNKQIYKYYCRPNYDEIMYKIKNSSRDYNDFLNYIRNNINTDKCEEWCYSYEQLITNCEDYNIYDALNSIDEDNIDRTYYINYNKLIGKLNKKMDEYSFDINNVDTISDVNHNLKVKNLGFIYKTLSLIRRYLFINEIPVNGLDFFEIFDKQEFIKLFSSEELENVKTNIFRYLLQLSRLENLFISSNINFSSRNYDSFETEFVCQLYNNLYNEDLICVQNEATDNLHNSLKKVLTRIEIWEEI